MLKKISVSTIVGYLHLVLVNSLNLFITPYVLKTYGSESYGVYTVIMTIAACLTIEGFSVGSVITRLVTKCRYEKADGMLYAQLSFAFKIYLFLGIFLSIATFLFLHYNFLFSYGKIHLDYDGIEYTYLAVCANILMSFIANFIFVTLIGFEKYVLTKVIFLVKMLIRIIGIFIITYMKLSIWNFAVLDLCITIVVTLVLFTSYLRCRRRPKVSCELYGNKKKEISFIIIVQSLIFVLCNIGSRIYIFILLMFLGSNEVTMFNIAFLINTAFLQLTSTISDYCLPSVTRNITDKSIDAHFFKILINFGRYIQVMLVMVILIFYYVGRELISAWIGEFGTVYEIALCLMICGLYPGVQALFNITDIARNKYGVRSAIALIETIGSVVLGSVFVPRYGITGVFISIIVKTLVFKVILTNIYYFEQKLKPVSFFMGVVPKMALCVAVSVCTNNIVFNFIKPHYVVQAIIVALIYLFIIYMLYLDKNEQSYLRSKSKNMIFIR